MKKYLITVLTTFAIMPTVSSMISQSNVFAKSTNSKNIQNPNRIETTSSKGLNWNYIQDSVDEAIDNPKKMLSMLDSNILQSEDLSELTQEQKNYAKSQTKKYIDTFKAKGFNESTQVTNYLQAENADFKEYYNNPEIGVTSTEAKILFEYFINKVDLDLYNYNTYKDAVNKLKNKILSKYYGINLEISFIDETLVNKTLLDKRNQDSIIDFIDDKISISVQVRINNGKLFEENIHLKNIKLFMIDNSFQEEIMKVVETYFSRENQQDLDLRLTDTYQKALQRVIGKINRRFPGLLGSKISLWPQINNQKPFSDRENIKDIMNQNASVALYIVSNYSTVYTHLYLHFDLNEVEIINVVLSKFYSADSDYLSQDLGLTTDTTFQEVINKFNQKLISLSSTVKVVAYLADENEAKNKLQKQYNPSQKNQLYHLNLGFKIVDFKSNAVKINLGIGKLALRNVTLGQEAQEVKKAFSDLQELISQIELANAISQTTAVILGVAAAAFWAAAWFFGISTIWAVTCTIAASVLGTAVAGMSIAMVTYKQKIANLLEGILLVWTINRLGIGLGLIIITIISSTNVVLTATSWINFGLILTVIGTFTTIYAWINYYLNTHK